MKYIAALVASLWLLSTLGGSRAMAETGSFSGKVTETMEAGGYTYVHVDTGTNKIWAAATRFAVKQGDLVSVPDAMPMKDFESKSLNRTFPVIYFANNILVNGGPTGAKKMPHGHPPMGTGSRENLPVGHPPVSIASQPKMDFTGLTPAKGGKTVAEIYAASASLEGKSVKLRGKVVKYNTKIMGKNWLHVQDGTGSTGSNDLLVTSTDEAKRGDTVLVEGKVVRNKDFGAGYKYNLLLEDAKVTVE